MFDVTARCVADACIGSQAVAVPNGAVGAVSGEVTP